MTVIGVIADVRRRCEEQSDPFVVSLRGAERPFCVIASPNEVKGEAISSLAFS
jgi:hypothetical protein